jgi:Probable transposase.
LASRTSVPTPCRNRGLRLEIAGDPNWPAYKKGRSDLWDDETDSTVRASQPVAVSDDARDTPLADETAALDIAANTLVACTTTTGEQYLYKGPELFQRFHETTQEVARLQSKLRKGRNSSERVRRLYRRRARRRDHSYTVGYNYVKMFGPPWGGHCSRA